MLSKCFLLSFVRKASLKLYVVAKNSFLFFLSLLVPPSLYSICVFAFFFLLHFFFVLVYFASFLLSLSLSLSLSFPRFYLILVFRCLSPFSPFSSLFSTSDKEASYVRTSLSVIASAAPTTSTSHSPPTRRTALVKWRPLNVNRHICCRDSANKNPAKPSPLPH